MTIHDILEEVKKKLHTESPQAELSHLYGIPKQTISGWVSGRSEPAQYVLLLLHRAVAGRSGKSGTYTDMSFQEIRAMTGLSQIRFAEKYQIPRRTLEDWERRPGGPPDYVKNLLYAAVSADMKKAQKAKK